MHILAIFGWLFIGIVIGVVGAWVYLTLSID